MIRTIVLRPTESNWPPPHGEIDFVLSESSGSIGLLFDYQGTLPEVENPTVHYWGEISDRRNFVQYAIDHDFGIAYITLNLMDPNALETVYRSFMQQSPVWTVEQLKERVRSSGSRKGNLFALALALNGIFDPEAYDLIRQGLQGLATEQRLDAAFAAAVLRWPELQPVLQHALRMETDEAVTRALTVAVQASGPRIQ